jgi:hypothetical protein
MPLADDQPEDRRRHPDDQRLQHHGAQHLAARGAHRPQQGELPRALRDGDREGVEDDERTHEQRDAGEHEQQRVQEAEAVLDRLCRVVGGLLPGLHLDRVRECTSGSAATWIESTVRG